MGFWCVFVRWFVCRFDGGLVCVFLEMMGFCNLYFGDENGEQWRGERDPEKALVEQTKEERECLMEERENRGLKLTGVKGVKLVMCIDTCQVMNGWFGARAATTLFLFFGGVAF